MKSTRVTRKMENAILELEKMANGKPFNTILIKDIAVKYKVTRAIGTLLLRTGYLKRLDRGVYIFSKPIDFDAALKVHSLQNELCMTRVSEIRKENIQLKFDKHTHVGLVNYSDLELCDELRSRGYDVLATKTIKL